MNEPFKLLKENNSQITFTMRSPQNLWFSTLKSKREEYEKYNYKYIDFDAIYQRDHVWSNEDKKLLLRSFFDDIPIGHVIFAKKKSKIGDWYEVIDGKQRLNTLFQFFSNELDYDGIYYKNLSTREKYNIDDKMISVGILHYPTQEQILETFIRYNSYGKRMDKWIIKNAEKMLYEIKKTKGE